MGHPHKIVVAGGMSAAARARRLSESAHIVVLEREYVSFANCGMPYHIGGDIPDREALLVQTPDRLAENLALDVRVGCEVVGIDPAAH